jgi:DNA-binding protein YbaB
MAKVEFRLVKQPRLICTITEKDDCLDVDGAIVRLEITSSMSDSEVESLKDTIMKKGAASVRVVKKMNAPAVVSHQNKPIVSTSSVREVIDEMIIESFSDDKETLKKVIETALSESGM